MTRKKPEGFLDTLKTIVYAVLIALIVRTFLFEPFNIPSGSMIPTLLVGDYLFVSKYSYGYSRYSFPLGQFLPRFLAGRVMASEPERGDIAVFKLPTQPGTDYIKRVVGLPGDSIQVQQGVLHINGVPVQRKLINDYGYRDAEGHIHAGKLYEETLPGGRAHPILEINDNAQLDNTGTYRVPDGHYFMMGDNRDNSQDSRVIDAVGFVPRENLVGRAEILFFSINGSFWQFWRWPTALRFDRFFTTLD
jgi:signal peptidase I